jgi:hypothetical protein
MAGNCTAAHERNIYGYSTHNTALLPEHVRACNAHAGMHVTQGGNERTFQKIYRIWWNTSYYSAGADVIEILHANIINTHTKLVPCRAEYQSGACNRGGLL